jgi:glycosyltransferase involved in cell wall biosynthesis
VPDPARDAGSAAIVSHMQALLGLGYQVGFVPALGLAQGDGAASRALTGMGVICWQLPWVGSVEEVLRRDGPGLDLVYLHRHGPMQRYAALARHWAPQARLVYSLADLHWLRAARAQALESGAARAHTLATGQDTLPPEIEALRHAELTAILAADAVITHSSHEAALLAADTPQAAVHLLPWAIAPRPVTTPFAGRDAIAFVGSYGHPPNLDAARTLLAEVMPAVWAEAPALRLLLAGSDLPASLRDAAAAAPGPVEVLGHIPDLAALWERCRLSAAPLRYGAGLKGKVLDSLAAGIPCLCSETAAEGMDLPATLAPLVTAGPAAMAAAILRLHRDEAACTALGQAGLDWIEDHFSSARIVAAMRDVAG